MTKSKELSKEEEDILHKTFYDDGLMVGIRKFYNYIKNTYPDVHITYRQITEWLKRQQMYQINQPTRQTKHIKSIVAHHKLEMLQMDLLDYSQNTAPNAYKYVVVIVDVFTRFVWLFPTINKEAKTITDLFTYFYDTKLKSLGDKVTKLITDEGGEFKGLDEFLTKHNIKHITSTSPQSQSIVERTNQTIRRLWQKYINVKDIKNRWAVLQEIGKMYNETYHSSIGTSPLKAFEMTQEERKKLEDEKTNEARNKVVKDEKRVLPIANSGKDLGIDDLVRIKHLKKGPLRKDKGYANWSEEVYKVIRKVRALRENTQPRYKLQNDKGDIIRKLYYREDLLHIPHDTNFGNNFDEKVHEKVHEKHSENIVVEKPKKTKKVVAKSDDRGFEALPKRISQRPKYLEDYE